jgi:hypothetical protein
VRIRKAQFALPLALAASLLPRLAAAQNEPKFDFAKAEAPKPVVEWRSQVKAGALMTTGNSQAKSATVAATLSRKQEANRVALEGGLAYGTTNVVQPNVDTTMAVPLITDLNRQTITTTNMWFVKGRDDHFFTENNSGYLSGQGAGDKIAGKTFYGGGQIGYSRQVFKNDKNLVVAEIGYDFSYERYVQQPNKTLDPVAVHSARVFAGEALTLSQATGITASVEAFFNLNKEGKALNHNTGQPGVDALHDTRIVGKAALTTTVWKSLSVAFGFTLRYDQNPAPFPIPKTVPPGSVWSPAAFPATGGTPFSDRVDTLTEASLIYTFL